MTARTLLVLSINLCAVALLINSCKDLGNESTVVLTSSFGSITIGVGGTAQATITGGNPPYSISQLPNSAIATASLSGSVLTVTAVGVGTTLVKVRDSDSDAPGIIDPNLDSPAHNEQEITIPITVTALPVLSAVPSSVTVSTGQSVNVTISNGVPPYTIDQAPAASLAAAQFVDPNIASAILRITGSSNASASGSTSVRVKDSSPSPEREVLVPITKTP